MLVSLLTPTRARPISLKHQIESLQGDSRVESLVGLDMDDPEFDAYWRIDVPRMGMFQKPRMMPAQWWNYLASFANGDFLMMGSDDQRFPDDKWLGILEELDPDEPAVIGFKTGNRHGPEHFELPTISRGLHRIMGYFTHPLILGIGSDTYINMVGEACKIKRYFPQAKVDRIHWAEGLRMREETDMNPSHDANIMRMMLALAETDIPRIMMQLTNSGLLMEVTEQSKQAIGKTHYSKA